MAETKEIARIVKNNQSSICINNNHLIRYAWGCGNTWFITKSKRQVMPKGSRLLMELKCKRVVLPLHTKEVYPSIGDVIKDVNGVKLLVIACDLF